jgi:hypothetical protein
VARSRCDIDGLGVGKALISAARGIRARTSSGRIFVEIRGKRGGLFAAPRRGIEVHMGTRERSVDQQKQGAQRGDQPNQRGDRDQPKPNKDAQRGQQPGDQTVGQGAHANLSTEQRTRIRQTITKQSNAPRVTNVNFNISVGTVVPRTMRLAPLPVTVVEYVPRWRGYMYFLVGDEIIVVEPGTHRIVAVLPA